MKSLLLHFLKCYGTCTVEEGEGLVYTAWASRVHGCEKIA